MCRMCLVIYQQTSANPANTIHVKTVFIWKFTSLNGVLKRRLTAKGTSVTNCEVLQLVLDEKYRIAVQRIFCRHYYTLGALVLTDLLFAFAFCKKKKKTGKLISPPRNPSSGWISFLPFDWEIRKRICKTILVNSGLLFAKYACACKTAVLKDSFSNPFSDFSIER